MLNRRTFRGPQARGRHQAPCREGGAMRRLEGTRWKRSEGGMPLGAAAKQQGCNLFQNYCEA